jgi:hypothetical protein
MSMSNMYWILMTDHQKQGPTIDFVSDKWIITTAERMTPRGDPVATDDMTNEEALAAASEVLAGAHGTWQMWPHDDWRAFVAEADAYGKAVGDAARTCVLNCMRTNEALRAAQNIADYLGEDVELHDDDGRWWVHPADENGECEAADYIGGYAMREDGNYIDDGGEIAAMSTRNMYRIISKDRAAVTFTLDRWKRSGHGRRKFIGRKPQSMREGFGARYEENAAI